MTDDIRSHLEVKLAVGLGHLRFNKLNFEYFREGKGIHPLISEAFRLFSPLLVVPYILGAEVAYFRRRRYFVRLEQQNVGIFALHEKPDTLYISSLAVAPGCRRLGIAEYMLLLSARLARRLKKTCLELSVLKTNVPALRLYRKFGFTVKEERKWSFILTKTL